MAKNNWVYVGHMLDMSQKAIELTQGINRPEYDQNEIYRYALTHLIQVIGEAAQQVSSDFKEAHPQVPWFEIIGMRNRIVHDYMNVDEDVIWEVIQHDLQPLVKSLVSIIPPEML
jgi:uncharacterized protein with HEPN domain